MNALRIPITLIGEEGCVFEECVSVASIQPPDTRALPVETATVSGRFESMGGEYLFRGHVQGEYEGACVRCLELARIPFDVEVAWVFAEGPEAVFEEIGHAVELDSGSAPDIEKELEAPRAFQGHDINLDPYVWEEVVFAQPSRFVCHDDCAGLCPHCGVNRNHHACHCADNDTQEPIGNRGLAVLADLFPELAPKQTKE